MILFGKKKSKEDVEKIKEVVEENKIPEEKKVAEEIREIADLKKIQEVEPPEKMEEAKPTKEEISTPEVTEEIKKKPFAPLFVKIDRYRSVLDAIKDLKSMILMMKNALRVQKEIEELWDENRKFLETAIEKINKKILSLDSDFLRPRGYEEGVLPPEYETEGFEGVVDDLKKQVEGLKSELKTIS